jgi:hypothetical protein
MNEAPVSSAPGGLPLRVRARPPRGDAPKPGPRPAPSGSSPPRPLSGTGFSLPFSAGGYLRSVHLGVVTVARDAVGAGARGGSCAAPAPAADFAAKVVGVADGDTITTVVVRGPRREAEGLERSQAARAGRSSRLTSRRGGPMRPIPSPPQARRPGQADGTATNRLPSCKAPGLIRGAVRAILIGASVDRPPTSSDEPAELRR